MANMATLAAEELLRDRGGSLSPEQLRAAVFQATGDRLAADKAAARRWLDQSRRRA